MFGIRLKWLGCACFELDFDGLHIVNDPWITVNQKNELTWESVEKCNYITLTHTHHDHIVDIPVLMEKFPAYLMCGEMAALPMMKWADVNPMRIYPMAANLELDMDKVKIKALYGRHGPLDGTGLERIEKWKSHPIHGQSEVLTELGILGDLEYRNYLFTTPNGTKVLIWGNKISRPDQRNMLKKEGADIGIIQVTGANKAEDMATACKEMGCKVVIPHHIDYPGDYMRQTLALKDALAAIAPEIQFIIPEYNKWIEL